MNYSDTTSALVINKLTKSQYETLKASGSLQSNQIYITPETLPSNLGDFNNDVGYVTASAVAASYATKGEVEVVSASVSSLESSVETLGSSVNGLASSVEALGSSVSDLGSQVIAMASSLSAKRDYLDLTYSTTVPSETIDNSKLVWDDKDPLYNAKLTFLVNDSVAGEEHLAWNDGEAMWIDSAKQNFMVWYAEDFGYDPEDGKFVLVDGADACFQFNLEDGVNVQTFNYASGNFSSTGTLTMTFTGEPAHQVNDNLALDSNLNVSGIGCSTVVMSGTYSDSTSFAFNVVVQPSA